MRATVSTGVRFIWHAVYCSAITFLGVSLSSFELKIGFASTTNELQPFVYVLLPAVYRSLLIMMAFCVMYGKQM